MSKSEVISAFDGLIVDLTRTVDQLERAINGDITISIGGAVLDHRVNDAILKRGSLKSNVIAGLAGAGFAYATVVLELLPLVALDAIKNNVSPDGYVEQFSALSERLRSAAETFRAVPEASPGDNDEPTVEVVGLGVTGLSGLTLEQVLAEQDEIDDNAIVSEPGKLEHVREVLAGLGIDADSVVETSPGVFEGLGTYDPSKLVEGVVGSPFNTEAPRAWGPCSEYPRNEERRFG